MLLPFYDESFYTGVTSVICHPCRLMFLNVVLCKFIPFAAFYG